MNSLPSIEFCTQCGQATEIQLTFGKPRPVCTGCGYIHFIDPKVAAAALVIQDDQVLLVRRTNEPFRGRWTLPAGFVDAGEEPAEAVVRECREETGLVIGSVRLLDVIGGREHPSGADIVIVYMAVVIAGELNPGDDADLAQFFPADQLPPLAFAATRQALAHWTEEV